MVAFILNNELVKTELPTGSLLLDLIRYDKCLTGTKIGCREGDCGACTVLIGTLKDGKIQYENATSCLTPIGNVQGKHVVTIEGLNMDDLTPVQQYMVKESGTQCGFCTVGFVVSLSGFCLANKNATYEDVIASIDGNICRCTGYKSIERAAQHITDELKGKDTDQTVNWLVDQQFIPSYFNTIAERLAEINNNSLKGEGKIVGGGTDLYVQQPDDLIVQNVNHISNYPNLKVIKVMDGICTVGGGTTVSDILNNTSFNEMFPRLKEHLKLVSSSPIRNISTLAGNFVNASPIGDMTAFFLALNAKITFENDRSIYLKDLYKGYKDLDMEKNEMIKNISFKVPSKNAQFNLEKVSKRIHLDIASVNTAALIEVENEIIVNANISAGGVGPIPTYLDNTCSFLIGKNLNAETIVEANKVLQKEISPITDVRGTEDYKRLLLRQLFFAHFITLYPEKIALEEMV
ncbi:FAD binding domain-containing protein [Paracrocinitomix mangrovi]|uniref:FAD binding domain-containing protein n=1 Tax=Paracrocinitomix mangrovi TaxID=2862509 RepID=UPI001EDC4FE5|nr:FAD binding domain-containing protein [Paracrocinitomix mangrovi]UKN00100.1 FAD binding domain-containing protein [Paracrocinitomix mangrovi]